MRALEISDLRYGVRRHFWTPTKQILRGVTLSVERGELFGFLGPNGAGKTTTIKAVLGLLRPDSGQTRLFGEPPTRPSVRARLGFMPERAYFPEHLTARELLVAHAALAGLGRAEAHRQVEELLERVGMRPAASERLGSFSKGMQQRIGLAQALVADPEIIILDEPMSGLDPVGRHDVRELMLDLRARGKTIFFSTHIIPDVESICDRVAILVGGEVRRTDTVAALLTTGTESEVEIVAENCSPAALTASGLPARPRGNAHYFSSGSLDAANRAVDTLRAHGATVVSLQTRRRSLEEIFVAESRASSEAV